MTPLTVTARDTDAGPVLEVAGELDYDTAPRLREAVESLSLEPGRRLVLDLGRMDFCDSSGITALIVAHHHANAAGARLSLVAVPARTLRTLRIAGLDQVFTISPGPGQDRKDTT
ncbi:STAS domain-containing protein [Streptomyces sp. NPDC016309]|uniref:STAS domain-containing protein n=1 Tax=Streptomyces sp. NPDC016309 TaxID=3364965 RepID=UPI0036FF29FA